MKNGGNGVGTLLIGATGIAVVGGLLWLAFAPVEDVDTVPMAKKTLRSDRGRSGSAEKSAKPGKKSKSAPNADKTVKKPRRHPAKPTITEDDLAHLSAADRKLVEDLQSVMDSDDHAKIIAAAVAALKSNTAEVRQEAVDALGWCGKDAIAELTGMLADADDDVRDSAINHWECALSEVEDPKFRYSTALAVMGTISKEDALDSISGQFSCAATEYIDDAENETLQGKRRTEVVQKLYDIIDGKTEICAEKAKAAYEDVTGFEWRGAAEAERYLANPEDYELPEDRDADL